jgi:drug/metabolite transporter (DMT)-like permease
MGAFGYAVQAGLYLGAVSLVEASQVALVFSVYPVLVMVAAIAIGRERGSWRRLAALVTALGGIVLVLGGAASGGFDAVGALLSFGSAVMYCVYILVGDRVLKGAPPVVLTALVCVGAFASWLTVSVLRGGPALAVGVAAWGWLTSLALVSTVGAILLFFAGMARVGPTVASLLSILEPVVTVVSAALVFGEALSAVQALGGALVLAAVAVVQWPSRGPRSGPPGARNEALGGSGGLPVDTVRG